QGSLMLISDHLNLMGANPLRGANDERFGPRFPDLTEVYDKEFQEIAIKEAQAMGLDLRRGIYAALSGPSYETPAEIRMLRALGADAVGMSTVPEAIVARHMGLRVLGICCGTGSGKTTVANKILESVSAADVAFLQQDSYYRNRAELPLDYRRQVNFDHPGAIDNELLIAHLRALKAGQAVELPLYDFK